MNSKPLTEDLLLPLLGDLMEPGPLGDGVVNLSVQGNHLPAGRLEVELSAAQAPLQIHHLRLERRLLLGDSLSHSFSG